jgi:hypothetical protein
MNDDTILLSENKYNKYSSPETLFICNSPKNISVLKKEIINDFSLNNSLIDNYKLNQNKINGIIAYLIVKDLFNKFFIFKNSDAITDFNSFIEVYKKYIKLDNSLKQGCNFFLKFYNSYSFIPNDFEFIQLKENNMTKINKTKSFLYIEKKLNKDNFFLLKNNKELIISYGKSIIVDINPDLINLFLNNTLNSDSIKKYYKYNKIKILYYVSIFI